MSRLSDLPRAPAHAGLLPASPTYGPAAPGLARALSAAVPGASRIEQLLEGGSAAETGRFFRAVPSPAGAPLFLKLVSESEYHAIAEAEAVIAPLPAEGPAVRSCGVYRVTDAERRVLVAYPYVEARFLDSTEADMRRLGRSIAELHAVLRSLPDAAQIRVRAIERARRLDATLARQASLRDLLGDGDVAPLAGGFAAATEGAGAQPLHGDLNVGNILCESRSGAIRFLDFEDTRHSYGPPIMDLALPLERFCLLLDDEARAVAAAVALLCGYADCSVMRPLSRSGDLAAALRVITQRAVALLIERREAGLESPQSEWRKFGALLRWHVERGKVISSIEQAMV